MMRNKKSLANPLVYAVAEKDGRDVRRKRRRLTDGEFDRTLAAVRAGRRGPRRAVHHRGVHRLRADEVAGLTPSSFRLDDSPPTVTVSADHCKRGTEDTIPIPPAIAARLAAFLAGRRRDDRGWSGKW